jgi:3-keto-disaccharide hydrolase
VLNSKSIWHRARTFRVLFAVACVTCVELGASAHDAAAKNHIGKSQIGAFDLDLSQGQWTVVGDATAAAGFAIEQSGAQTTEDRFPLAISKTVPLKNAEISVRLKATGRKSDRDSGLALRLMTPETYYLVELDARRDRIVFSVVNEGVSNEIAAFDADIASQTWYTLTVLAVGDEFVVSLDGNWVFTVFDKTLSQAGRIALWTKGDSVTRFDQIEIAPLP